MKRKRGEERKFLKCLIKGTTLFFSMGKILNLSNIFFTLSVVISNSVITIIQFDNKSYNAHN